MIKYEEKFIINGNKVHNGFYKYDLVEYIHSHIKVKIICPVHGIFEQTVSNHLRGTGCPNCSKRYINDNNRLSLFPNLIKDWDYNRNEKLNPDQIACSSNKKVWWKCKKCNYKWYCSPNTRKRNGKFSVCPRCFNRFIDETNCILISNPELCKEWNYEKNIIDIKKIAPHSSKKVWWRCKKCCFDWEAKVNNRVFLKRGCPRCSNKYIDETNCLLTKNPELCKEWDYNKNIINPTQVALNSNKKVWWKCSVCGHGWMACIGTRSRQKTGCPKCVNQYIDETNCLLTKNPELCKEWNYEKNELGPETYAPKSPKKVWWKCKKCNHSWETSISHRANGRDCPECFGHISKEEIAFVKFLKNKNNTEYKIISQIDIDYKIIIKDFQKRVGKLFKPDVFIKVKETIIIVEYDGDFWHLGASIKKDKNLVINKLFSEMKENTEKRTSIIKNAGFNIINITSIEWNKYLKNNILSLNITKLFNILNIKEI